MGALELGWPIRVVSSHFATLIITGCGLLLKGGVTLGEAVLFSQSNPQGRSIPEGWLGHIPSSSWNKTFVPEGRSGHMDFILSTMGSHWRVFRMKCCSLIYIFHMITCCFLKSTECSNRIREIKYICAKAKASIRFPSVISSFHLDDWKS